ncbi:unnamed protein product, partial [Hapterophycus canaliculatus]
LVCRRVAELAVAEGIEFGNEVHGALATVVELRDSMSCLLSVPALGKRGDPGADASGGHVSTRRIDELVFAWDPFLVAWRWLEEGVERLRTVLSDSAIMGSIVNLAPSFATLAAVGARVNSAVLQHAGGASPARDTLWKRGPRAAAPSSAAGATALAKVRRLADEFRVLPSSSHADAGTPTVALSGLMREAHPALCATLETRREFLHALCTLQWAASNELKDDILSRHADRRQPDEPLYTIQGGGKALAESLPRVLETMLRSARARFEAGHKGTRLGVADRRDDGLEHHQDDLEFGEKFDDFDTEAAEAVSNATLLVVSGDVGDVEGPGGADSAAGGGQASSGGVLQDWAVVQLSPLIEHWIGVEECHILSSLAKFDVSFASGQQQHGLADEDVAALMARIARLRSCMLAAPSVSPLAARTHQTLLWAWDDQTGWPDVCGPLLKKLLPVAMESFGRRLWENVVAAPGAVSLRLAPPDMVAQSVVDGSNRSGREVSGRRDGVDLTLMNASARLQQFRVAMRGVRDLGYVHGATGATGALQPLVEISWASLSRALGAFDKLGRDSSASANDGRFTFAAALSAARSTAIDSAKNASKFSCDKVREYVREAVGTCPDERLAAQGEALVVPAVVHLSRALAAFDVPVTEGPTRLVEATAGLGVTLLGCLKLVLLLPSTPVDPGLRPALKKDILAERLEGVKGELTIKRWSLRLEGRGDVSPEMLPLLRQARGLRDTCNKLGLEAIERPEDRPNFHALFRDVYAFARGVGDPSRVTVLARSLARYVGVAVHVDDGKMGLGGWEGGGDGMGGQKKAADLAGLLQEEAVWQGAAGAFVSRLGLRVLAAACSSCPPGGSPSSASSAEVHPLARLQGMLLSFPYPCCEGLTGTGDVSGDGLGETLQTTLEPEGLQSLSEMGAVENRGAGAGAQHIMVLQAVLSRAELLLASGCCGQPALDAAVSAMEGAVAAWTRVEAEEAEKRLKEAEILKYKMQEHLVESEEATNLAKLRALFPDYHSAFKDLVVEHAEQDEGGDDGAGAREGDEAEVDARVKALGHMSDKQLSLVVARHSRIFLSLSDHRRRQVHLVLTSLLPRRGRISPTAEGAGGGEEKSGYRSLEASPFTCSDAQRAVAFGDSYRASVLLAAPTSRLPSCSVLPARMSDEATVDEACTGSKQASPVAVVHMEEAFAASHLLALANAARLCKSGRSLLEDAVGDSKTAVIGKPKKRGRKEVKAAGASGGGWLGEGAVARN